MNCPECLNSKKKIGFWVGIIAGIATVLGLVLDNIRDDNPTIIVNVSPPPNPPSPVMFPTPNILPISIPTSTGTTPTDVGTFCADCCDGIGACENNKGTIGDGSCNADNACTDNTGIIGESSCDG